MALMVGLAIGPAVASARPKIRDKTFVGALVLAANANLLRWMMCRRLPR